MTSQPQKQEVEGGGLGEGWGVSDLVWEDVKVLERDGGDSCTKPLNWTQSGSNG